MTNKKPNIHKYDLYIPKVQYDHCISILFVMIRYFIRYTDISFNVVTNQTLSSCSAVDRFYKQHCQSFVLKNAIIPIIIILLYKTRWWWLFNNDKMRLIPFSHCALMNDVWMNVVCYVLRVDWYCTDDEFDNPFWYSARLHRLLMSQSWLCTEIMPTELCATCSIHSWWQLKPSLTRVSLLTFCYHTMTDTHR